MKKVFFTLILVSIVILASGQSRSANRDIRPNMSLDKNKTYTLDFFNGLSFPQGSLNNFLKDGFNSGVLIHKRFTRKLSIGLSANHSRFNYKQGFGAVQSLRRQELSTTSFDIGPQYNLTWGRFALELYGRSGLSIVNSPHSIMLYPETDITITSLEAYKSTALTTRVGANMTANIAEGLNIYLSSEYITSLNSDMNYQTRDLSTAFRDDGSLNSDMASELPYRNESLSLSMLNVNLGVRISFGGQSHRKKPNPLYQSRGYASGNPFYEKIRLMPVQGESKGKAQDSNSSRSNKSSREVVESDSTQNRGVYAQDYKSSRSLNSSIIAPNPDVNATKLDAESVLDDDTSLVDIPEEKLKLKTKAQLAKERRKKKRIARRLKRLKAKL